VSAERCETLLRAGEPGDVGPLASPAHVMHSITKGNTSKPNVGKCGIDTEKKPSDSPLKSGWLPMALTNCLAISGVSTREVISVL